MSFILALIFIVVLFWVYRYLKIDVKRLNLILLSIFFLYLVLILSMDNLYPYSKKSYIDLYTDVIKSEVSSKILEVKTAPGSQIKAGDVVFELDRTLFEEDVKKIQENNESIDSAIYEVALEQAQNNLEECSVRSAMSGYVRTLHVKQLDEISATTELADVVDEEKSHIVALYDKKYFSTIKVGDSAQVSFDSIVGHTFDAKVVDVIENINDMKYDDLLDNQESFSNYILVELALAEPINLSKVPTKDKTEVIIYEDRINLILMLRKVLFALQNWKNIIN